MRLMFVFVFLLGLVSCGHDCTQWKYKKVKTFHKNGKLKSELECYVRTCANDGRDSSKMTRIKKGIYYHENGLVNSLLISGEITFPEERRGYKVIKGGYTYLEKYDQWVIETADHRIEDADDYSAFHWNDLGNRIRTWKFKCDDALCYITYSKSGDGSIFKYDIRNKDGTVDKGNYEDVRRNPKFIRQFTECDDLKKLLSSFGVVEKKKGGLSEALDNLTIY